MLHQVLVYLEIILRAWVSDTCERETPADPSLFIMLLCGLHSMNE